MIISKIRSSRYTKGIALLLAVSFLSEILAPTRAFALTGGPAQPEFNSFTPVGTSDMVNLSSGDFTYNIPLMDVGGYPLNLAYNSGVGMDQEASWVGLGWDLSVGQINRNVRGLPDDFKGDTMTYENYMKPNITVGGSFKFTPALFGAELLDREGNAQQDSSKAQLSFGLSLQYNSYHGFSVSPTIGANMGGAMGSQDKSSVGFNGSFESGPDGLSISPNLSFHGKHTSEAKKTNSLTSGVGVAFNSRQGLSAMSLKLGVGTNRIKGKDRKLKGSSSISFTDYLYTPTKRVGMETKNFSVNVALGAEVFGGEGQGQARAFGSVMKINDSEKNITLPSYGYSFSHEAGLDAILDFNREKDGNINKNTTNLALTNFTYDIYTVQGQGVGGNYRPHRNQVGFVTDPYVADGSTSFAVGGEIGTGNAAHLGFDFETTDVYSYSGMWYNDNYMYPFLKKGSATEYKPAYEDVHYANVGDLSVSSDFLSMFNQTGGYHSTRIDWNFNGPKFNRKAKNRFMVKTDVTGDESAQQVSNRIHLNNRKPRNQAIVNLTWADLENGVGYGPNVNKPKPSFAKSHHTAEVQIIRNDGARYIYGTAAYNTTKVEATFAVNNNGNCLNGLVWYNPSDVSSPKNLPGDKFLDRTTTPGYAHTYLLTSVLSTDYQDRSGNGPTRDDYGSYTKFEYKKTPTLYKWRVPYEENHATYSEGLRADEDDQRGNYIYGEKEQYYIKKIETKTHVAIFHTSPRKDAYGVLGEGGGLDNTATSEKLDSIQLFSIDEYNFPGTPSPIKTVHFKYGYDLCQGVPNNIDGGGKLTLNKVYFTYRDSKMGKYTAYDFTYSNSNPVYNIKGYDSWGNYKLNIGSCSNSGEPVASEFPYINEDKITQDKNSESWSLKEINLPSGGKIIVNYESDDYQFVQNKRTMKMFKIAGTGMSRNGTGKINTDDSEVLYDGQLMNKARTYLYVQVDDSESTSLSFEEIKKKYLEDVINEPIYFRFLMNMTKSGKNNPVPSDAKYEYVSGYFEYEEVNTGNGYDGDSKIFLDNNKKYLSIPVKIVNKEGGLIGATGATNKVHPISKAGWHFGRKYLNKHVYSNQSNGSTEDISQIAADLFTPKVINNLLEVFTGPNATLENKSIARRFMKKKSWIRLNNPEPNKLGGGSRVSKLEMSDIWEDMNPGLGDYQTMNYGQHYDYTLDGEKSSGVATYEPVGNKENPFVKPVFSSEKKLLAPDEDNYVEKPFGESFFPSPQVTYSQVTVSNLVAGKALSSGFTDPVVKKLHRTGKVVTQFYTSKDYPTIVDQTRMIGKEDKQEILGNILNINVRKHFTATQGYTVHLNDMNGKEKAKYVYAEGQDAPISWVKYNYDNHSIANAFSASSLSGLNRGKLNNKVVVINPDGTVERRTIGVEIDVVNDFRENATQTTVSGINANLATFIAGVIPAFVPIPLPDFSSSKDKMRIATTTKVVNTFGILKEVIAFDAGATVKTRNLAWDAKTGEVLLTETDDEYSDKYYTLNYPAHWYYDGMGQAADNVLFERGFFQASSGVYRLNLPVGDFSSNYLVAGDELILNSSQLAWVKSIGGNHFELIDENGVAITGASGRLKVIRSGRRNLQSAGIMNVTLMRNPLLGAGSTNLVNKLGPDFLMASSIEWDKWRIIDAGAVDYSDIWKTPCDCDEDEKGISNPYRENEKGVWRTKSSRTYLTGRNHQTETTPRQEGYYNKFSPMYIYSASGSLYKNFTNWTFVSEVSRYSPYGVELENKDALNRFSAAQYGYNNMFPIAVGAYTQYSEIGFDGFEDYNFEECPESNHFGFKGVNQIELSDQHFHTGKYSAMLQANTKVTFSQFIGCGKEVPPLPPCDLEAEFEITAATDPRRPPFYSVSSNISGGQSNYTYTWSIISSTGNFDDFSINPMNIHDSFTHLSSSTGAYPLPNHTICLLLIVTDSQECTEEFEICFNGVGDIVP